MMSIREAATIQRIHMRLCRRAVALRSFIAALEEAAEEIMALEAKLRRRR